MNLEYVYKRIDEMNTDGQINDHYIKGIIKLFDNQTITTPSVVPSEMNGISLIWHKKGCDVEIDFDPNETFVWVRNKETREYTSSTLFELWGYVQHVLVSDFFYNPYNIPASWVKIDTL